MEMAHKKDPNRTYNPNWGGKREGSGRATGRPVGHNGGRKPPEIPKRQRNIYVTDEEFEKIKDYMWNVLRKDAPQGNRKHKVEEE
jgi:hypothetical protein